MTEKCERFTFYAAKHVRIPSPFTRHSDRHRGFVESETILFGFVGRFFVPTIAAVLPNSCRRQDLRVCKFECSAHAAD
jgi:hypothetical protein